MIILFFLFLIVVGFLISGIMAPMIIAANRKRLKKMREIVAHYEHTLKSSSMDTEMAYRDTIRRLYNEKYLIKAVDKESCRIADGIIQEFKDRN